MQEPPWRPSMAQVWRRSFRRCSSRSAFLTSSRSTIRTNSWPEDPMRPRTLRFGRSRVGHGAVDARHPLKSARPCLVPTRMPFESQQPPQVAATTSSVGRSPLGHSGADPSSPIASRAAARATAAARRRTAGRDRPQRVPPFCGRWRASVVGQRPASRSAPQLRHACAIAVKTTGCAVVAGGTAGGPGIPIPLQAFDTRRRAWPDGAAT